MRRREIFAVLRAIRCNEIRALATAPEQRFFRRLGFVRAQAVSMVRVSFAMLLSITTVAALARTAALPGRTRGLPVSMSLSSRCVASTWRTTVPMAKDKGFVSVAWSPKAGAWRDERMQMKRAGLKPPPTPARSFPTLPELQMPPPALLLLVAALAVGGLVARNPAVLAPLAKVGIVANAVVNYFFALVLRVLAKAVLGIEMLLSLVGL